MCDRWCQSKDERERSRRSRDKNDDEGGRDKTGDERHRSKEERRHDRAKDNDDNKDAEKDQKQRVTAHFMYAMFRRKQWGHLELFKSSPVKNEWILVISGKQNFEDMSSWMVINLYTLPVNCSHCTLWKAGNFHLMYLVYM